MGENKKNIFVVGSPDVDMILGKDLPNLNIVKKGMISHSKITR